MTYHPNPRKAHEDLTRILEDLERGEPSGGTTVRRQARRIRQAVDCILMTASAQGLPADDNSKPLSVELPQVTESAATFLTIHHLLLASAYYEAAGPELELELARGFGVGRDNPPHIGLDAARAWLRTIDRTYDELDREDKVLGPDDQPA